MTGSAVRFSKLFTTSCIVWTSKSWTMIRKATAAELLVSGYVFSFFMGLSLDALLSFRRVPLLRREDEPVQNKRAAAEGHVRYMSSPFTSA